VEPGIYLPGWGGIRIEDMVVVGTSRCQVLTTAHKSPVVELTRR
jgi:Xaa-Pro aminopeptidase